MPGRVVIQWDKDDCADMGLVKVDLLGLGMMAVLQETIHLCEERARPMDLAQMPKDDAPTFEMMQRADTIGVFQSESRAQMATGDPYVKNVRPCRRDTQKAAASPRPPSYAILRRP